MSSTTNPTYELLYHPTIPGRGEYIRLALEASYTPYTDVANTDTKSGYARSLAILKQDGFDESGNLPTFALPALRVRFGDDSQGKGKELLISQTPNVLLYLASKLGLGPESSSLGDSNVYDEKEAALLRLNQLLLTVLDLSNETHDLHHPINVMDYYEDQKEEALRRSVSFRDQRVPKFLGYFEKVLKANEENGNGKYLIGKSLTVADTTLWQVLDGLSYAIPKQMEFLKSSGDYPLLLGPFRNGIAEEKGIKEYLKSDRRLPYSMGLYRHYPELDRR